MEFSISTNVFGKVGVPTIQPKQLPLPNPRWFFHFYAPTKPGSYPITYLAEGSSDVILIGTIVVN